MTKEESVLCEEAGLTEIDLKHYSHNYSITPRESLSAMREYAKQESILFAKWLQHLDNGTTHYNPFTKETSESIGFSPSDCLENAIYTHEQLYEKYQQSKEKQ